MLEGRSLNPERARGPAHLTHVEGMRALAALIVFVNHAYAQVWLSGLVHPTPPWYVRPFLYSMVAGHLSVTVFIVISGFCLTLPVARKDGRLSDGILGFLKRRARRILPPYYAAVAFSLFLIFTIIGKPSGSLWDVPIQLRPDAVISHFVLMQDLFGTGIINYVFWSIAVEWHIYLLFPLLVWSWRRYGEKVTVPAALALGYGIRLAFGDTRLERACPHYIGLFALGMLAAYVTQSTHPRFLSARERAPWGAVAFVGFALACCLSVSGDVFAARARFYIIDLPVAVATMGALVLTSRTHDSLLTRLFSWRPIAFVGTFSYSVYLIHAPLLQVLWQYVLVPSRVSPLVMFGALMSLGALLILGAAYVFFRLFEEPFMRQSSRRGLSASADASPAAEGLASAVASDRGMR